MKNKAKYILDLFKHIYSVSENYDINYGLNNKSKIQIKSGNIEYFKKSEELSLENVIWKNWNGEKIPFLFDDKDNEILTFGNESVTINFDIFASSFYLLSCWQEYVNKKRDKYGRFQLKNSLQHKLNIVFQPTVNYYFDILKFAIEKAYNTKLYSRFWGENDFAVFSSHDIDSCESAWKEASFWQLRNKNLLMPPRLILNKLMGKDGWFNFDEVLETEELLGIKSTFFFISNSKPRSGFRNGDYNLQNNKFFPVFEKILNHNSEIGLHAGFGAHLKSEYLIDDTKRMPRKIFGNRFHYLNFDAEKTPYLLQNIDLKYDSTLGFAESAGYRSSFCLPYFLYDIKNDQQTSVVEIPLVFMDTSLRLKSYMNLSRSQIIELATKIIDETKKHKGIFSINWHNTRFSDLKDPGWRDIFIEIIRICRNNNSKFLTGNEICANFI